MLLQRIHPKNIHVYRLPTQGLQPCPRHFLTQECLLPQSSILLIQWECLSFFIFSSCRTTHCLLLASCLLPGPTWCRLARRHWTCALTAVADKILLPNNQREGHFYCLIPDLAFFLHHFLNIWKPTHGLNCRQMRYITVNTMWLYKLIQKHLLIRPWHPVCWSQSLRE